MGESMKKTRAMSRRLKGIISRLDDDNLSRVYFLASGIYASKQGLDADPLEKKRLGIMRKVAGIEDAATLDAICGITNMVQAHGKPFESLFQECIGIRKKLADTQRLMQMFRDTHMETMKAITGEKSLLTHSMESLDGILALMGICVDRLDEAITKEAGVNMNGSK
jgi:hypothetical protein